LIETTFGVSPKADKLVDKLKESKSAQKQKTVSHNSPTVEDDSSNSDDIDLNDLSKSTDQ